MTRANRNFSPGFIWHVTQRCHNHEYLLRFHQDRLRWMDWMLESIKRYRISVLNYMLTSNHIHLLAQNKFHKNSIAKTMQLVSGRVAQEYNDRRGRRGAYWEGRYKATAIETDEHFIKCMTYIDLNMVRAGVVRHPCEWKYSGYQEILGYRRKNNLIDMKSLILILNIKAENLSDLYAKWIEDALAAEPIERDTRWTENLAVGSRAFIESFRQKTGARMKRRAIIEYNGVFGLREKRASYQKTRPKN